MKKILYMAVAAIAALSSCSSNDDILDDGGQQAADVTEFTATIEGDGTRTSYNASDKKAEWLTTDQINVGGAVYTAKTAGATTTFSGEGAVKTGDVYKAYYPSSMYSGGTITLPASYDYDGKFNMPMYAESPTTNLSFKNLCGVLAITVPSTQMTSVSSIVVSADQQMNGELSGITDAGVLTFKSATLSDAEKKVSLTFTEAKGITDSETFYLPVPAMSSATLTITVSNGTDTKTMSTKSGVVSVERNTMYPITFKAAQMINGHKYVVLAGYKWATENVTASGSISAAAHDDTYGDYFSQDGSGGGTPAKQAAESWGGSWTLPTSTQWQALITNCNWTWQDGYSYNGNTVSGYLVTGKDSEAGNSIFLPAAGLFSYGVLDLQGDFGCYWSSAEDLYLRFGGGSQGVDDYDPFMGMSVRPVSE